MVTKSKQKDSKSTATQNTKHRTGALERTYIDGYGNRLWVYTLAASKYWWVRDNIGGKVVKKSTKQTDKRKAIAFAREFHDVASYNYRHGVGATSKSNFELTAQEMLKAEKAKFERGAITKITYDNTKYRLDKSVLPSFRDYDVTDVDYTALDGYLNELSEQELSTSTISAYMRLVRKVLVHAARKKLIQAVPEFPIVTVKDKARGWFTTSEFVRVWRCAQRYVGKTIEVRKYTDAEGETQTQYVDAGSTEPRLGKLMRNVVMTEDLRRLIVFMKNSYIRPTDIKFMQHKHVDVIDNEYKYLRLRLPPTKNHSDPITTMPYAVNVYQQLRQYHDKNNGLAAETDYVFLPKYGQKQRDYALKQLQRQFEILMWDTGLGVGSKGEQRTLYSLRHTSIMHRLLYGDNINTLLIARNARTSVEMVDRFYAKPLSGEMNIEALQSKRRKRVYYDGDDANGA
jgi:hypothetical protein